MKKYYELRILYKKEWLVVEACKSLDEAVKERDQYKGYPEEEKKIFEITTSEKEVINKERKE